MKTLANSAYIAVLAASAFLLSACDSSDCEDNRNSLPIAAFMSSGSSPQAVMLDTLRIAGIGAPADSVLSVYNAAQAYLPFNNDSHTTSFVLRYNKIPEELFDTITFTYDPAPRFESADCGVFYKYTMREIAHTTHFVDSVTCPAGVIDNTPGQNLFIYLRSQ
ncbi:MAG: DUF6452 family protein [Prevotella sp.]|nr:DUF6452 family protein [Prevotella sp.]MCM1074138.1 DUF6452 family protein [Ruminococcus sp.]